MPGEGGRVGAATSHSARHKNVAGKEATAGTKMVWGFGLFFALPSFEQLPPGFARMKKKPSQAHRKTNS